MKKIDLFFYIILCIGILFTVVAYTTLPDGKYCTITYHNQTIVQHPKSVCMEIHKMAKDETIMTANEVQDLIDFKPNCPKCKDCPPPQIKTIYKQGDCPKPKPCPIPETHFTTSISTTTICSPQTTVYTPCPNIDKGTIAEIQDYKCAGSSPAYQGGCYDMKRRILIALGGNYTKFREAPSSGWYQHLYGRTAEEGLICFPDKSTKKDKSEFHLDNTIWMIGNFGSQKRVYKK